MRLLEQLLNEIPPEQIGRMVASANNIKSRDIAPKRPGKLKGPIDEIVVGPIKNTIRGLY